MIPGQISVVLIRSQGAFNVGSVARAMHNMGIDRLVLVNPQTEIDVKAREGAASAQAILARRIVYDSMDEFLKSEGEGLRLAFTRRDGHRRGLYNFSDFCREELAPKMKTQFAETPIYLIFGSEDDGLSNEELEFANYCVMLPTYGENGSYNLSQAVLIATFILQSEFAKQGLATETQPAKPLQRSSVEFPKSLVETWLETLGFNLSENRRKNAGEIVNNMLLRSVPTKDESRIFSGILHQTIRKLKYKPIGYVKSVFKTRFGTPRQPLLVPSAQATLELRRDLQPELALEELEKFSHIWLIFEFHENLNKIARPKVHPPRLEGKTVGVFASRSPHRPNPIGLSLVKLEKIEGGTLYLSGIDLIDGSPVLDIKPYIKYVESQPNATEGWLQNPIPQLNVTFYQGFEDDIRREQPVLTDSEIDELKTLIEEVIEKDPRPQVYRETNHKDEHAVYLGPWNVLFRFGENSVHVLKVEFFQRDS